MALALHDLRTALGQVFARPSYVALGAVLSIVTFLLAVWLPNLPLIAEVFSMPDAPLDAKLGIALSLLGGIATNFTLFSAGYTVTIAILFGVTTSMIVYLLTRRRLAAAGQNIAIGAGGMASGVIGVGCAACGSLIVGVVFPALGLGGALAALPLGGEEFGILSVVLLLASVLLVSRNIAGSAACPVALNKNAARSLRSDAARMADRCREP